MLSIGVHIAGEGIRFAELELVRGRLKLGLLEEAFFKEGGSLKEKRLLISRYIERAEERHEGKSARFCYGLSQSAVTGFFIEFPFKEKFKILKTLPFEIEDQSPFRPDKVFFDARISKIEGKKSAALCFVTPESYVNDFLDLSRKLKPQPSLLSCEGSALANLLEFWGKPLSQAQVPAGAALYIYLGGQNSQVFFYKGGSLASVSVLDWPSAGIVEEMEKLYKLERPKAWEEFFEKSFILTSSKGWTKEQIFFSNLIKKQVELLIPKLKLLKISLETEQKASVSEAVLFGPGASIRNLTVFLSERLSVNFSRLKALPPLSGFEWESRPSFLPALGLALEGLKSSPYQGLNFLQSIKKDSFFLYPQKWRSLGLSLLFCFFALTAYVFARKRESAKALDQMQSLFLDYGKKIAFLPESQVSESSVRSFLERERGKKLSERAVREKLKEKNPMDSLQKLSQELGPASQWSLRLVYLKAEGRKMEIRGWADSSALSDFKSKLSALAKSPLKDLSPAHSPEKKGLLSSKTEKSAAEEGSLSGEKPPKNLPKKKGGASSPQKAGRSFFAYSFELKERL